MTPGQPKNGRGDAGRVAIPDQARQAIFAHAANWAPDECCGLVAMDDGGKVVFVYPLTNADPSPVSYTVDPDEHFSALRHAESQGWEIAGVFHSHPRGPAAPSMVDVQAALDPDWVYLVVAPEELRGYRIRGGAITELVLV